MADLKQLIDARQGSNDALGELLEACRTYLLGIAERELDSPLRAKGGASDLVQETFLEAHRDFPKFEGTTEEELLGWLRRMLLNNLHNFARHYRGTDKRRMEREVYYDPHASGADAMPLPADTPTPSRAAMADEESLALEAAMSRLSEEHQFVLRARYFDGRSFDDIAGQMGRSSDAVRQLWVRAVSRLQKEFDIP